MTKFAIFPIAMAGRGTLALSQLPGRSGDLSADLAHIENWGAALVISMTTADEMALHGAADLEQRLAQVGVDWAHMPVVDFGVPSSGQVAVWHQISEQAKDVLCKDGRVLIHCHGGCGRSGMAAFRLMIDAGEDPQAALARLRAVRPCAVETGEQLGWAAGSSAAS